MKSICRKLCSASAASLLGLSLLLTACSSPVEMFYYQLPQLAQNQQQLCCQRAGVGGGAGDGGELSQHQCADFANLRGAIG